MKLNNALALPLVFCVTALALVVGCSRFNPVSIPNPIPAPQTVLSNGVAGTWLGNVLTPSSYGGCSANPAIVPVTDTLSDDSSTLQLTTTSTCGLYIFSSPVTVNPSSYYAKGHLQFDILLGNPPANFSSISIQYLYSNGSNATCNLSANLINSLSNYRFHPRFHSIYIFYGQLLHHQCRYSFLCLMADLGYRLLYHTRQYRLDIELKHKSILFSFPSTINSVKVCEPTFSYLPKYLVAPIWFLGL
jgi:hypothetical protein